MTSLRIILDHAAEYDYAVPAFNVNTLEQAIAIMDAAEAECAPAILQFTSLSRDHFGDQMLSSILHGLRASYPTVPLCIHQDHGFDLATCASAINGGFTSVMIDGTFLPDLIGPSDFEHNLRLTKQVSEYAHTRDVSVEGALGVVGSLVSCVGSMEDGPESTIELARDRLVTDLDQAVVFVEQTRVDALAVAVGTTHGLNKFEHSPSEGELELGILDAIHERLPNTHLVMHGCSSIPKELVDAINEHGGQLPPSWGMPVELIQSAIKRGLRKVNIDTDNRLAMTAGVRKYLTDTPADFDPRNYLRSGMESVTALCRQRYKEFGASGQVGRMKLN
jgi:fructose-bisphosphate aldolase, class II